MTTLAQFASLLQERMGLSAHSVGLPVIESALKTRLSAGGCKDLREYWEHLHASGTELQELIDAVIIPETWFFRDREAFAALAQDASNKWLRLNPSGEMRLLSLPCASGEEPYSMAMALLGAGFPASQFRIDGVDISVRGLERARNAVYGRNSFRGKELAFRDRFFEPVGGEFRLAESVRAQAHFHHGNLLDPGLMANAPAYDFIFCRNLLIYFDAATQDRAVEVLKRLLKPDATLFVGPSESALFLNHDFVSAKISLAFAFRRKPRAAVESDAKVVRLREPRRSWAPKAAPPAAKPVIRQVTAPRPAAAVTPSAASGTALDEIASLANQGSLTEAIQRGEAFLRDHGPSAQVYHLMGLAHDASGMPEQAEHYYRKALYLDPAHHEALIHLAFLLEKHGDSAGAQRLHMRAKRANSGGRS
ncbi:MAG TPA: CheR family methyltransferase [Burkholderiales bacterium]|nr:CheR family methyltransferase [Burkholderiales bacterium]